MVGGLKNAAAWCLASCAMAKGALFFAAKAWYFSVSSSTPMATMTSPLPAYFWCSRAMAGNDALQGAHHEAQKSTSTTLPVVFGTEAPGSRPLRLGNADPIAGSAVALIVRPMQRPARMV